jgi:hypothetical protein
VSEGDGVTSIDHSAALSWRDVYRAVSESEDRIIAAVKDSVGPLRTISDDHEMRIRKIEAEGSAEAREALRVAIALGVRLDGIAQRVNDNTAARKGMFDTLSAGNRTILFIAAFIGMVAVLLDIFSKYLGGS